MPLAAQPPHEPPDAGRASHAEAAATPGGGLHLPRVGTEGGGLLKELGLAERDFAM